MLAKLGHRSFAARTSLSEATGRRFRHTVASPFATLALTLSFR